MKRFLFVAALAAFTGLAGVSNVHAENWPQWRGADRANRSSETGLFKSWGADGRSCCGQPTAWGQVTPVCP